jgi:hypothetical protein
MAEQRRTRAQWRRLVEGWRDSGLTQSQYCARHRISVASLRRWRDVFDRESEVGAGAASARADGAIRLLPVEVREPALAAGGGTPLALVIGERLRVEIAPGFDAPTLRRLVAVLQGGASA